MSALRTRRLPGRMFGFSLYAVEAKRPAPTFHKGDGKDGGRNLLGALLIGSSWDTIGWVLGHRGAWHAYTDADWRAQTRVRGYRSAPVSQWSVQATVADAAEAVRLMDEQRRAA